MEYPWYQCLVLATTGWVLAAVFVVKSSSVIMLSYMLFEHDTQFDEEMVLLSKSTYVGLVAFYNGA